MIPFDTDGAFHPKAGNHELRHLAIRGAGATVSASGFALAAQVISTVVLARLVAPADFGVVAMATTFSLFLVSFGLNGFTEAVIQIDEIDCATASNLFWVNSLAGLTLAGAFAAAGSLLVRLYGNPLVASVARSLAVGIVISAFSVIHLALLKRGVQFGATSTNEFIGRGINTVVAIGLAVKGFGYWALVAGIVAQQLSIAIGAWWLCRWIPSLPRRTGKTGALVRFAASVYAQYGIRYCSRNMDNLLVGWRFQAVALGFYKKAYDLFALSASQLIEPLHSVALATLSRLIQDPPRFRRYLVKSLGIIAFVGMAVSAELTLVGEYVVRLVLGPKWSESGRIFELFGPGIGAMHLCGAVSWIHLSIGRPERLLRWTLVELTLTASLFLAALPWGPAGIAVAWSASYWILLLPGFWYAGRPIGFGVSTMIASVWKFAASALAASLLTGAIIRNTRFHELSSGTASSLGAIAVISIMFCAFYLGSIVVVHQSIAPVRQILDILLELVPVRRVARRAAEQAGEEERLTSYP